MAIKEFGVEKSKPINSGFFFWKYSYVEAPYVVERRGLDILINGILIRPGPEWPQRQPSKVELVVKEDPGDPPAAYKPWQDPSDYIVRKWAYLSAKYAAKEARRRLIEALKRSPEIKDASWRPGEDEESVSLTFTKNPGEVVEVLGHSGDSTEVEKPISKKQALEIATGEGEDCQTTLRYGCLFCMVELGGGMEMNRDHALDVVALILSGAKPAEKIEQLQKAALYHSEIAKLVTECPRNEQLAKRFERLKKGEVEEEPVEPPAPAGDVQAGQAPQSKAVTYVWLGGALALVAVLVTLVAWQLRRK